MGFTSNLGDDVCSSVVRQNTYSRQFITVDKAVRTLTTTKQKFRSSEVQKFRSMPPARYAYGTLREREQEFKNARIQQ
jgi:hypothetical protein